MWDELERIARANRMPSRWLSAESHEAWRSGVPPHSEMVSQHRLPSGGDALLLTTSVASPRAVNHLIRAELVVRAEDWRPVSQRLLVQGDGETLEYGPCGGWPNGARRAGRLNCQLHRGVSSRTWRATI